MTSPSSAPAKAPVATVASLQKANAKLKAIIVLAAIVVLLLVATQSFTNLSLPGTPFSNPGGEENNNTALGTTPIKIASSQDAAGVTIDSARNAAASAASIDEIVSGFA